MGCFDHLPTIRLQNLKPIRMKTLIFCGVMLFAMSGMLQAQQSLKDALYGGRLKNDSGSVIKKTDDIKSKIDTSVKKTLEIKAKDSVAKAEVRADSLKQEKIKENVVSASKEITKDNNTLWKDFIDKLNTDIRAEVMTSKKIKNGSYSILVDYEIGIDGSVNVNNVSSDPSNSFLENQIKERIIQGAPKLTPALLSNGKPRVSNKKQMLSYAKDKD
jgi:predicted RND superfamily exporter protein